MRRTSARSDNFYPFGLAPLFGLLLLFAVGFLPFAHEWVESTAEKTARGALIDIGASWATPAASGQWVTLTGTPPSDEAAARAISAIRNATTKTIFGGSAHPVTRVIAAFDETNRPPEDAEPVSEPVSPVQNTDATPDILPATSQALGDWEFSLIDGVLQLSGEVGDDATRTRLGSAAQDQLDPPRIAEISNELSIGDVTANDATLDVSMRGLQSILLCDQGTATFSDAIFSMRCELPEAAVADIEAILAPPLAIGEIGSTVLLPNEAIDSCEAALREILQDTKVQFATNSATINEQSASILDNIAEQAKQCPGTLRIEGHTDDRGDNGYNAALSGDRAQAVKSALIERGVADGSLSAEGFGEDRPIADNATPAGRAANRRIEIRVIRATE